MMKQRKGAHEPQIVRVKENLKLSTMGLATAKDIFVKPLTDPHRCVSALD